MRKYVLISSLFINNFWLHLNYFQISHIPVNNFVFDILVSYISKRIKILVHSLYFCLVKDMHGYSITYTHTASSLARLVQSAINYDLSKNLTHFYGNAQTHEANGKSPSITYRLFSYILCTFT